MTTIKEITDLIEKEQILTAILDPKALETRAEEAKKEGYKYEIKAEEEKKKIKDYPDLQVTGPILTGTRITLGSYLRQATENGLGKNPTIQRYTKIYKGWLYLGV